MNESTVSVVHPDWHTSRFNGKEVCVVLDDSSRFILAGGEFRAATAENKIELVRKALEDYGKIRKIREVITDHGSQFLPEKRIKMENLKALSANSWRKTRFFKIEQMVPRHIGPRCLPVL